MTATASTDRVDVPRIRSTDVRRKLTRAGWFVAAVVSVAAGEHWLADWLRSAGVGVVGDQPAYLSQSQALLTGSVHTSGVYATDLAHHWFSAFPPGTRMSAAVFESFKGPHGVVTPFEPGLAVLVAPFLAVGGQTGAFVGFFLLEAAGLVFLHRRVTGLCRLRWRAQVCLGVALVSPAVAAAASQLYPDLLSGIVLAIALVEVARVELRAHLDIWPPVLAAAAAVLLPWLQVKNVLPAVVVVAALVVAWRRGPRRPWLHLAGPVLLVVTGWALEGGYNLFYFGHLSGYPEPSLGWNRAGLIRTVGLVFDRHQGLLVQLPTVALGVIGLRWALRRAPAASAATVLAVGAVLVLNGTYQGNPYGGVTLAGRFEWTAMPVCVGLGGFALEAWQREGRALLRASAVIAAAWILQFDALVAHRHTGLYFTQLTGWDPAVYPGWWPGLDRLLPRFVLSDRLLGQPATGTLLVVVLTATLVWLPSTKVRGAFTSARRWNLVGCTALVALAVTTVWLDPGPGLPARPLTFPGAAIGSPLVASTASARGPAVPLQGIAPGTYRLTVNYHLVGPSEASLAAFCDATPTGGPVLASRTVVLAPARQLASVAISCARSGAVAAQISAPSGSILQIDQLSLAKTSTG